MLVLHACIVLLCLFHYKGAHVSLIHTVMLINPVKWLLKKKQSMFKFIKPMQRCLIPGAFDSKVPHIGNTEAKV